MKNEKFLIVGYGNMGQRYHRLLKEICHNCEVYVKTRDNGFKEFGVDRFDAAFICTPSDLHLRSAIDVLKNFGPTPMLIEKPVTNRCDESDEISYLIDYSIEHSIAIYIAYNLRHSSAMKEISSALCDYRGPLRPTAVCRTNSDLWPGKRKLDSASVELSHEVDYLLYLFGQAKNVIDIVTLDEKRALVRIQHGNGILSNAYLDMRSPVEERYLSLHPHNYNSGIFHITKEDIDFSYYSQIHYFMKNLNSPFINNNISEAILVSDEEPEDEE